MKFCRYDDGRYGIVRDDAIVDVTASVERLIADGERPAHGDPFVANLAVMAGARGAAACRVDDVCLLSPVARPSKLIAAPVNYAAHVAESEQDAGISFNHAVAGIDQAGLFLKATTSLVGPGEGVAVRFPERRTDHEVELAVIIGRTCANVPVDRALDVVAGYAIGLDMSIRGTEDRSMRKSIDSYSVLGPWLVTADEIPSAGALALSLRVNGQLRQSSNTRQLLRGVRHLIAWASEWYTLYPGDVVYTGTPEGVGPVTDGDVMLAEIEAIGSMQVRVRAHASAAYAPAAHNVGVA